MTNSFVLYKGLHQAIDLTESCRQLTTFRSKPEMIKSEDLTIGFSHAFQTNLRFSKEGITIWLLPTAYDSIVDTSVVNHLYELILSDKICADIPLDSPSFLAYNTKKKKLYVFNSSPGFMPFYYGLKEEGFWLTTEAKAFIKSDLFPLILRSYDFFSTLNYQSPIETKSIFKNLNRLKSDELLMINEHNEIKCYSTKKDKSKNEILALNEDEICDHLYNLLNGVTQKVIRTSKKNGLALSGGYDSGSIAGLLFRNKAPFSSFTIGSSTINEYAAAKIVSDASQSKHYPILLDEDNYLATYLKMVYINEINDVVIAEAFVGIYEAYHFAKSQCTDLFTGYGADILLGNLLKEKEGNLNEAAFNFLQRTALSGELSPFIADYFGLKIHPIYLNKDIIEFCLKIPGELKTKNGINKYIQRKMIETQQLLPAEVLDIKKKGLHEGAGLPSILSNKLGTASNDYSLKNKFLYNSLKLLFEDGIAPENCAIETIINQTKKQEYYDTKRN